MKMKWSQFFLLMGAIYLAPHAERWVANVMAVFFTGLAIYCSFKGE